MVTVVGITIPQWPLSRFLEIHDFCRKDWKFDKCLLISLCRKATGVYFMDLSVSVDASTSQLATRGALPMGWWSIIGDANFSTCQARVCRIYVSLSFLLPPPPRSSPRHRQFARQHPHRADRKAAHTHTHTRQLSENPLDRISEHIVLNESK